MRQACVLTIPVQRVLRNEVWLREISAESEQQLSTSKRFRSENARAAQGSQQYEWQRGIVRFSTHAGNAFSGSELTETCRIITRPTSLPGFKVLDGRRPPTIRIQPSVELFAKTFETMTGGLLKGLDWDHVFVAGGIVLGALLCTEGKDTTNTPEQWKNSDVDLYICGLGPVEANEKIEHIFSVFKSNLPQDAPVLVVRNSKTITFFSKYPLRRIQIVLKLVESPKDVLLNFDLDICAIGWDGEEVWMLPRAARALQSKWNSIAPTSF